MSFMSSASDDADDQETECVHTYHVYEFIRPIKWKLTNANVEILEERLGKFGQDSFDQILGVFDSKKITEISRHVKIAHDSLETYVHKYLEESNGK